jgi:adenylylsulfate kinase-like enzyme
MPTIWITGLPGSGKTTLAKKLIKMFNAAGKSTVLLDGDELRNCLGRRFGYSRKDRLAISKIYVNLAKLFEKQGHTVIVSTVSLIKELHNYRKANLPKAVVILINPDASLLDLRNKKNLRNKGTRNSMGISLKAEMPGKVDINLHGSEGHHETLLLFTELQRLLK